MSNEQILDGMFNKNTTNPRDEIICIVDRSGSMGSIRTDAEGGVNAFITEQKEVEGRSANLTLVEFDDVVDTVHDRAEITFVDKYTLKPRGMTALYDAIGKTLNGFPDVDDKKIVVIVTDGGENASREYSGTMINEMISDLKEKGWEFLFLAANQDAIKTGSTIGIDASNSVNFVASAAGAEAAYDTAAKYATSYRSCSKSEALADLELTKYMSDVIS